MSTINKHSSNENDWLLMKWFCHHKYNFGLRSQFNPSHQLRNSVSSVVHKQLVIVIGTRYSNIKLKTLMNWLYVDWMRNVVIFDNIKYSQADRNWTWNNCVQNIWNFDSKLFQELAVEPTTDSRLRVQWAIWATIQFTFHIRIGYFKSNK